MTILHVAVSQTATEDTRPHTWSCLTIGKWLSSDSTILIDYIAVDYITLCYSNWPELKTTMNSIMNNVLTMTCDEFTLAIVGGPEMACAAGWVVPAAVADDTAGIISR